MVSARHPLSPLKVCGYLRVHCNPLHDISGITLKKEAQQLIQTGYVRIPTRDLVIFHGISNARSKVQMQGALADSPVVSVGALGRRNDVTSTPRADVMPVSTALFRSRPRPWTLQLPTTILPFITTTTTTTSQVMAALTSRSALRSVAAFSRPTAACTPRFSSSVHGNDPHVRFHSILSPLHPTLTSTRAGPRD